MIIYKATNKVNGKCYIGQTRHSLEERRNAHYAKARQGIKTHFYSAIRKYGEDNFEWRILCTAQNKQDLNRLETFFITQYDSIKNGYNMVDGGDNNIMDIESVKTKHDRIMQSKEVRSKISSSMKRYRSEHPFTEEHRRKLSEKAMGNHNFGNPDTRSVACYCVDENGEEHHFKNYLQAGLWWYETYSPFPYSTCVYQRKIKQSIDCGYTVYGRHGNRKVFNYPKWFKGGDANEKVTNT